MTTRKAAIIGALIGGWISLLGVFVASFGVDISIRVRGNNLVYFLLPGSILLPASWQGIFAAATALLLNCAMYAAVAVALRLGARSIAIRER